SGKGHSKVLGTFTRSGLRLESVHQEPPHTDGSWTWASNVPLLNNKQQKKNWSVAQWSKVLFSDESKFCISFGNQGPRVWRKNGEAHTARC
ncbi:hypothetical protein PGIGA_G00101890, partial [Pangasianodon gigas]|nr:hypothetical protein [Pangasianodon gigas]